MIFGRFWEFPYLEISELQKIVRAGNFKIIRLFLVRLRSLEIKRVDCNDIPGIFLVPKKEIGVT